MVSLKVRVDLAVQISNMTSWSDKPLGRAPQKRRRMPFEKQLVSCCYILLSDGR